MIFLCINRKLHSTAQPIHHKFSQSLFSHTCNCIKPLFNAPFVFVRLRNSHLSREHLLIRFPPQLHRLWDSRCLSDDITRQSLLAKAKKPDERFSSSNLIMLFLCDYIIASGQQNANWLWLTMAVRHTKAITQFQINRPFGIFSSSISLTGVA